MGTAQHNEQVARSFMGCFIDHDPSRLVDLLHEDVQWHVPGRHQFAGTKKGRGEVMTYLGGVMAATVDGLTYDCHDILGSEDHAVMLVTINARRGAVHLSVNGAFVLHIESETVHEIWFHPDDLHLIESFWAS